MSLPSLFASRVGMLLAPTDIASTSAIRTETAMRTIETIPGESSSSIISSIINLICPQCGGSMMEFQCNGRCGRNWLAEWEWVNFSRSASTRSRRS